MLATEKIAQMLNLPRRQTVQEWKEKLGWKRVNYPEISDESSDENIQIWTEIGKKALAFIRTGDFKTMSEALKVLGKSIDILKKSKLFPEEGETRKKPVPFLRALEKYSEKTDDS